MTDEWTYELVVEHDPDVTPDDYDCYDANDKERFANGDWTFVYAYPRVKRHNWTTGVSTTHSGGGLGGIDWNFDQKSKDYLRELLTDDIDLLAEELGIEFPPASEWDIAER